MTAQKDKTFLARLSDSPVWWSLKNSLTAQIALAAGILLIVLAVGAPIFSTQNPFDLASIDISFANLPPSWTESGDPMFLFGTDDQGRDLWSAMLYGMRLSLTISVIAVALSILLGLSLIHI